MIDQYHYMSSYEFWIYFQDQIPEHLKARIEATLISEVNKADLLDLENEFASLESTLRCTEDELYDLSKYVDCLESDTDCYKKEIEQLKEELQSLKSPKLKIIGAEDVL